MFSHVFDWLEECLPTALSFTQSYCEAMPGEFNHEARWAWKMGKIRAIAIFSCRTIAVRTFFKKPFRVSLFLAILGPLSRYRATADSASPPAPFPF